MDYYGWNLVALGALGVITISFAILFHELMLRLRRRRVFRLRHERGTVRRISRRGYRVDSLWGIGGGK